MKRNISVIILCLPWGITGSGCSSRADEDNESRPQVVVLLSLDTLRADRLGVYGYKRKTALRLRALASESIRFATVMAQSTQTLISHKSIFTGKYPLHLAHETTGADLDALGSLDDPQGYLVDTFRNLKSKPLAALFREHGYETAAFTDGGWMSQEMGFTKGFDVYDDRGGHLANILPRVYDWVEKNRSKRFFLFVHTYDTHCPYPCREPYNSLFCEDHSKHVALEGLCGKPDLMNMSLTPTDLTAISDHYDGGIASADAYVGVFMDKLRQWNLFDQALIIVTSDHGESLGDHDQIGHGGLYLEQLMVPLIIKFPTSWNVAPAVIQAGVEMVDVMPTICEICSLDTPDDLNGHSLLSLIGEPVEAHRYLIAQTTYREGRQAVTNPSKRAILDPGDWLLIHDARGQSMELFDLRADPKGHINVAKENPNKLQNLLQAQAAYDPQPFRGNITEQETDEISEKVKQQLRSLGYGGN